MRRQCQIPACRVARSQKKAPCPNKRAAIGRCLRVALPEAKRTIDAALKPAGVSSWGSTLPPDDSKQGPRGVGMISGIQPVVFSTTSCRRREKMGKNRSLPTLFPFLRPYLVIPVLAASQTNWETPIPPPNPELHKPNFLHHQPLLP